MIPEAWSGSFIDKCRPKRQKSGPRFTGRKINAWTALTRDQSNKSRQRRNKCGVETYKFFQNWLRVLFQCLGRGIYRVQGVVVGFWVESPKIRKKFRLNFFLPIFRAWKRSPAVGTLFERLLFLESAYLLGLLAKIKCSICSYQLNLWYVDKSRHDD